MTNTWLVTGASRGLGRAIAEEALRRGDRVVATVRDTSALADLADPARVLALKLDLADAAGREAVGSVVAEAEAWARDTAGSDTAGVDVLVNNAGHGLVGALEELSDADVARVLGVNVLGALAMTRAVLPHMRARRRGHVVAMSSVGGVVANPGHALYATAKFALEGMSEALAGEAAPFGVRVTIVEPGPFRTDFAGTSMHTATAIADYADTPAGALRSGMAAQDGAQAGDPARAAAAIADAVGDPSSPLRLPLGVRAVDRIRAKLRAQLADLDRTEATARWADAAPS